MNKPSDLWTFESLHNINLSCCNPPLFIRSIIHRKTDFLRNRISNCLYRPSYISLESALSHYNFIPEGVYTIQNISTRKTILYETPIGSFQYRNIKPGVFFGYHVIRINYNYNGRIALMLTIVGQAPIA